jgi:hypothetical protein
VAAVQVISKPGVERVLNPGIRLVSAATFLEELTV